MTELPVYMNGLFAMLAIAGLTAWRHVDERSALMRTAGAIFANWVAGLVYVQNTGNLTPWHFNIFIDALAAAAVLYHPAGRAQGFIGLFYGFQIAFHVAVGFRLLLDFPVDLLFYYDAITWIAWAQLLAIGGWCGTVWGRSALHRFWRCSLEADRLAGRRHIHEIKGGRT